MKKQIKTKKLTLEQKIDKILELLQEPQQIDGTPYQIPTPTTPYPWPVQPFWPPNIYPINPWPSTPIEGWKCPTCGIVVMPNTTHFCSGTGYLGNGTTNL